ncbi:chymotrypsin-2-like [Arctopsyche grandis]|uniref:chymotrypsin-2-like n=1 Tax=Arctopsyche grandis TaxID=121162 RepID=UPI00406D8530
MFLAVILVLGVLGGSSGNAINSRIIGGTPETSPVRHVVSVQNLELKHLCGGTIVNTQWVLTSATCAKTPGIRYVSAGITSLNTYDAVLHVNKIILHPDFIPEDELNDIALLKTLQHFVFSIRIAPADFPIYDLGSGYTMSVSGWGVTSKTSDTFSISLRSITLRSLSNEECRLDIEPKREIYDLQICGIRSAGKGVCTGDTGNGLVFSGSIHGIVGKTANRENCASGYPEVFTRVNAFMPWIDRVISNN